MAGTVAVLVVHPSGAAAVEQVEAALDPMQQLIGGGWLEGIRGDSWHAYMDEEGKLKGMPVNAGATALARALGWDPGRADVLVGVVLFLGTSPAGDEASVPDEVLDIARRVGLVIA